MGQGTSAALAAVFETPAEDARDARRPRATLHLVPRAPNPDPPCAADAACERRLTEARDDAQLIERFREGDALAFTELVSRHRHRAESVARRLVRNPEDAREVVQEAFARVARSLDSFRGQSTFFTWFYRIVTNLSVDESRRAYHRRVELTDSPDLGAHAEAPFRAQIHGEPDVELHRRALGRALAESIAQLPSYHREVIILREVNGMSYDEIAAATHVSRGTVMSRLFHARKKLQRALESWA